MGRGMKAGKKPKAKPDKWELPDSERRNIHHAIRISEAITMITLHGMGWRKMGIDGVMSNAEKELLRVKEYCSNRYGSPGILVQIMYSPEIKKAEQYTTIKLRGVFPYMLGQMRDAHRFMLSVMIIALAQATRWDKDQMDEFVEGYLALAEEVKPGSKISTPEELYNWCLEMTGIDVRKVE